MHKHIIAAAFQTMLNNTADMVFVKSADLVYVAASLPFARMVGKASIEEIIGKTDFEIFDETLAKRYTSDDYKLLGEGNDLIDYLEPLADDHGYARYASTSKHILSDPSGAVLGILGISRDVTREYFARQYYQQELKYLFELPADTYAAVFIDIDSWRIISQRRQLIDESTLPSCGTVDTLLEKAMEGIADPECEAAKFYKNFSPSFLWNIYLSGKRNLSLKYLRTMPDHSKRWVQNNIQFITDPEHGTLCVMLSARDIRSEKQQEENLLLAAQMDIMTMVFNRDTTMKFIQQILAAEPDKYHALLMLDVDNFKTLNDTMGHQAGDEFLIALARELRRLFRESDVVGRIGGDEFFILMRNVPDLSAVQNKARTLLSAAQTICARYPSVPLSISVGISMYPQHGKTLEDLYNKADQTLYDSKKGGKNRFTLA